MAEILATYRREARRGSAKLGSSSDKKTALSERHSGSDMTEDVGAASMQSKLDYVSGFLSSDAAEIVEFGNRASVVSQNLESPALSAERLSDTVPAAGASTLQTKTSKLEKGIASLALGRRGASVPENVETAANGDCQGLEKSPTKGRKRSWFWSPRKQTRDVTSENSKAPADSDTIQHQAEDGAEETYQALAEDMPSRPKTKRSLSFFKMGPLRKPAKESKKAVGKYLVKLLAKATSSDITMIKGSHLKCLVSTSWITSDDDNQEENNPHGQWHGIPGLFESLSKRPVTKQSVVAHKALIILHILVLEGSPAVFAQLQENVSILETISAAWGLATSDKLQQDGSGDHLALSKRLPVIDLVEPYSRYLLKKLKLHQQFPCLEGNYSIGAYLWKVQRYPSWLKEEWKMDVGHQLSLLEGLLELASELANIGTLALSTETSAALQKAASIDLRSSIIVPAVADLYGLYLAVTFFLSQLCLYMGLDEQILEQVTNAEEVPRPSPTADRQTANEATLTNGMEPAAEDGRNDDSQPMTMIREATTPSPPDVSPAWKGVLAAATGSPTEAKLSKQERRSKDKLMFKRLVRVIKSYTSAYHSMRCLFSSAKYMPKVAHMEEIHLPILRKFPDIYQPVQPDFYPLPSNRPELAKANNSLCQRFQAYMVARGTAKMKERKYRRIRKKMRKKIFNARTFDMHMLSEVDVSTPITPMTSFQIKTNSVNQGDYLTPTEQAPRLSDRSFSMNRIPQPRRPSTPGRIRVGYHTSPPKKNKSKHSSAHERTVDPGTDPWAAVFNRRRASINSIESTTTSRSSVQSDQPEQHVQHEQPDQPQPDIEITAGTHDGTTNEYYHHEPRDSIKPAQSSTADAGILETAVIEEKENQVEAETRIADADQTKFWPEPEIDFSELKLLRRIGIGAFAEVYAAVWRGRKVAVKKMLLDSDNGQRGRGANIPGAEREVQVIEEFKAELQLLRRLRHPHIIQFFTAVTKPPNLCMVTELLGCNLFDRLHNSSAPLPHKLALKIALGTAQGVGFLHQHRPAILHRDLKSPNVLLTANHSPKVCDFGLARRQAGIMTGNCGTFQWMAPEVMKGNVYTEKADVYSFGIIMWELLARKVPYTDMNPVQASLSVMKGERPALSEIERTSASKEYIQLMEQCWSPTPEKRPSFTTIVRILKQLQALAV